MSGRWLAIGASVVVVATVAAAIHVMGTPAMQREARLDRKRIEDLRRLTRAVQAHAQQHSALPRELHALAGRGSRLPLRDPQDHAPYAYEVTGPRTFRLCAVFATDSAQTGDADRDSWDADWSHGVGRQCFDRNTRTRD